MSICYGIGIRGDYVMMNFYTTTRCTVVVVLVSRGVNEPSRAKLYLNRPRPVMHKVNIGLGLGLVVGFFSEKSLGPRKILKA